MALQVQLKAGLSQQFALIFLILNTAKQQTTRKRKAEALPVPHQEEYENGKMDHCYAALQKIQMCCWMKCEVQSDNVRSALEYITDSW